MPSISSILTISFITFTVISFVILMLYFSTDKGSDNTITPTKFLYRQLSKPSKTNFDNLPNDNAKLNFQRYRLSVPFKSPYSADYYIDFQNSIRKLTLNTLGKNELTNIKVVSQLYGRDQNDEHYHDMLTAIQINLLNPFISEYHFLQEDSFNDQDLMSLVNSHKLHIKILGKRLSLGEFMIYCNNNLRNSIVIFTNTDIYFDHSILYANRMGDKKSYAISRRQTFIADYLEGSNRDHCINGYNGSHDVFIYNTNELFPKHVIDRVINLHLGYAGSENVIIHHTKYDLRYSVTNPCISINVFHLHEKRSDVIPKRINNGQNTAMEYPVEL